jgi:hypothetical protein
MHVYWYSIKSQAKQMYTILNSDCLIIFPGGGTGKSLSLWPEDVEYVQNADCNFFYLLNTIHPDVLLDTKE